MKNKLTKKEDLEIRTIWKDIDYICSISKNKKEVQSALTSFLIKSKYNKTIIIFLEFIFYHPLKKGEIDFKGTLYRLFTK